MPPRSRSWVFTWSNYPVNYSATLNAAGSLYWLVGLEVAPTTGTPHLQGLIYFKNAASKTAVRKKLPGCHVEQMKGTLEQAMTYCKKDGNWVDQGNAPMTQKEKGDGEKERWKETLELAMKGDIQEIDPEIQIRYYSALQRIASDNQPVLLNLVSTCGYWIHGPSGCGKSTLVREQHPDHYPKPLNKWWDGYTGELAVIIDDIDPTHSSWLGYFIKIWADRFPFIAEIKGKSRKIRPQAIIVTSQYTIDEVFSEQQTRDAVNRRFKRWEFNANFPLVIDLVANEVADEVILIE